MAEPYVPVHAVTYEMTDDGPVIVTNQVVTAETDTRPKPEPVATRRVPRPAVTPDRPSTAAPAAEKGE